MKKKTLAIAVILCVICLSGCVSVASESFSAVGFTHGNTKTSAFMEFKKFRGNMVFALEPGEGGRIHCNADLEAGKITVYEKTDSGREELFKINAGEDVDTSFSSDEAKITVIVETDEACENGNIRFEVEEEL
ncbi:MAG: hypothetical protein K6F73_00020 [Lachnospiraceae bacterium]|nr:hypothetical protein [Lachnospiraceae bacterium]